MIEDANLDKMQKALRIAYELERFYEENDKGLYCSIELLGVINGAIFCISNKENCETLSLNRYYYDAKVTGHTMDDLIADVAREYRKATGRRYDTEKEYANNDYQGKEEMQ